jgi:hypothetical protein
MQAPKHTAADNICAHSSGGRPLTARRLCPTPADRTAAAAATHTLTAVAAVPAAAIQNAAAEQLEKLRSVPQQRQHLVDSWQHSSTKALRALRAPALRSTTAGRQDSPQT